MQFTIPCLSFLLAVMAVEVNTQRTEDAPNLYQVTFGYNMLSGKSPPQQHQENIGMKLFDLTRNSGVSNGYKKYSEIGFIQSMGDCSFKIQSSSNYWSRSQSSLSFQSSSNSNGFDKKTDLSVEVPAGPATVGAKTTTRDALVFGNSKDSSEAFEKESSGYTHSISSTHEQGLYRVALNYDNIDTWTKSLKFACEELGNKPTVVQVLRFFKKYGTHGLKSATFGKQCSKTLWIEGGHTSDYYQTLHSTTSNKVLGMAWASSNDSKSNTNGNSEKNLNGFEYLESNVQCKGELKRNSSCDEHLLKGTDRNAPVIIDWSLKPIWEMAIPTLTKGAKQQMKNAFRGVEYGSYLCSNRKCSGNGVCAVNEYAWNYKLYDLQKEEWYQFNSLFDGTKCFCNNNIVGEKCNQFIYELKEGTREAITIYPGIWGDWKPWWDGPGESYAACGAEIRYEDSCGGCDDTAANGIRLQYCDLNNWYKQKEREIHTGFWGNWKNMKKCPKGQYIGGARVQFEDSCGDCDDTALNGLQLYCVDREWNNGSTKVVHVGHWGKWKAWRFSKKHHFVTGARVRYEGKGGDDTALNGIEFRVQEAGTL